MFEAHAIESTLRSALRRAKDRARSSGGSVLACTSTSIEPLDPINFFEGLRCEPASLWLGQDGSSLVGAGTAIDLRGTGTDRFADVSAAWHELLSTAVVDHAGPIAFGGFRFSPKRRASDLWRGFHDAVLTIPRLTLSTRHGVAELVVAELVSADSDIDQLVDKTMTFWRRLRDGYGVSAGRSSDVASIKTDAGSRQPWNDLVADAVRAIDQGQLSKVVVARTLDIELASRPHVASIIRRLHRENSSACTFAFSKHGACFLGATPETLLSLEGRSFHTMALAGTIGRGTDAGEDARLGSALMTSGKDRREHDFVVQTIRTALAPVCERIEASETPRLHKLARVQHLMTTFDGLVSPGVTAIELVGRLHPTPAVGGVERAAALSFIEQHENLDRGWYASPVGWVRGQDRAEFMVSLRSGLLDGRIATLFAGCGVVEGSQAESEYQETALKFATMLEALHPQRNANAAVAVNDR